MTAGIQQRLELGEYADAVRRRVACWDEAGFARRLWAKDPTLWFDRDQPELSDRLGWLDLPHSMRAQAAGIQAFADQARSEGMRSVVLLGMGGSSLAPEVFQRTFGNRPAYPELMVLDSTHPDAVRAVERRINPAATLFLASSKSGTTLETLSFVRYFWRLVGRHAATPGRHFAAITDPETPLVTLAREREFRRVFTTPADVGGRYSALTAFGLVPAALLGMDIAGLLDRARAVGASVEAGAVAQNPALELGAAMGELARAGRDKTTFLVSPSLAAYPIWVEQLVAESTGKDGRGIVPVADEPARAPDAYAGDRFFVHLYCTGDERADAASFERAEALAAAGQPVAAVELPDLLALGAEMYRAQVAVAAAGAALGIHPFNQPDVQLAKDLANQEMSGAGGTESLEDQPVRARDSAALRQALGELAGSVRPGDYVGIQAYLAPADQTTHDLQALRRVLGAWTGAATTLGYGPRFLHSTGQLHKGGANNGVFLQLLDEPQDDLAVPETDFTFGRFIRAQADGDYKALRQRGRRALRVQLGSDVKGGLAALVDSLPA